MLRLLHYRRHRWCRCCRWCWWLLLLLLRYHLLVDPIDAQLPKVNGFVDSRDDGIVPVEAGHALAQLGARFGGAGSDSCVFPITAGQPGTHAARTA
uniref:Putative secreted protein n=1 Tax=Anopheles marajoara TaxID=58244 RepID=A0A2M4C977_9DIPT